MRYFFPALLCLLLFTGCGMHGVKCPMAGNWYSTIDEIKVLLELTCVDGIAAGGLKLLEDPEGELSAGAILPIIEGTCSNETVRFFVDIDQNGTKSDEDVYMELHLEGKEKLIGFGHELDDVDDKRDLTFTR
jgi:hypothetical protein